MAVKTHTLFYKRNDGEGANISVQIVHFFCWVQCLSVTFAALMCQTKLETVALPPRPSTLAAKCFLTRCIMPGHNYCLPL